MNDKKTEGAAGAICGDDHSSIHTIKQYKEHEALINKNPFACIDCFCGVPFGFQSNKRELAIMRRYFKKVIK